MDGSLHPSFDVIGDAQSLRTVLNSTIRSTPYQLQEETVGGLNENRETGTRIDPGDAMILASTKGNTGHHNDEAALIGDDVLLPPGPARRRPAAGTGSGGHVAGRHRAHLNEYIETQRTLGAYRLHEAKIYRPRSRDYRRTGRWRKAGRWIINEREGKRQTIWIWNLTSCHRHQEIKAEKNFIAEQAIAGIITGIKRHLD